MNALGPTLSRSAVPVLSAVCAGVGAVLLASAATDVLIPAALVVLGLLMAGSERRR